MNELSKQIWFVAWLTGLIGFSGACHRDMYDQPRFEPLEKSDFFADGRSARPLPAGAVPYLQLPNDTPLQTGRANGALIEDIPVPISVVLLKRGQERFNIYCSVCHGRTGNGDGMIVQRGYRRPPSYHSDRLRGLPVGHFFDVMTHGYGAMPSYASQVSVADRWAIAAFIRALQMSQFAKADELPDNIRQALDRGVQQ
jgi:mono/diheme cytochrome c family protein